MKRFIMFWCAGLVMGFLALAWSAETPTKQETLRHVVSLKFKDNTAADQIRQVVDAFVALKGKIPGIKALEWGTNVSPEKLNKGLTHCFILTFNSEKDRDAYLIHPAHQAFGGILGPVMADVQVIDFWARQ